MFSDYKNGTPKGTCDGNLSIFLDDMVYEIKRWMPVLAVFGFIALIDIHHINMGGYWNHFLL